jgi:hypothetical protein
MTRVPRECSVELGAGSSRSSEASFPKPQDAPTRTATYLFRRWPKDMDNTPDLVANSS